MDDNKLGGNKADVKNLKKRKFQRHEENPDAEERGLLVYDVRG